ncbi:ribosomal protein L11 methyltransferase [Secundilactobacillus paracollinoides]|uniref:Ribosomal protein L11 methyltransferase n=1 Tax=Secundilactobacillus paracollinoides TaxID=240427 RepID=A0A1B2J0H5_9LACO|nr:50S ribosomal protein L11 methyltransferase [Secundilactobacillus paracollinoides]ANZ61895.1 ribosomal protein L11 methyltransferase [Secundilactobacillus paracollinoides]ANZ63534.1 ribosomal protein L11 methyltransferase [Secundilactobacillus paracollinoides]ANZ67815.1 ribosomal protein L11 methyltransferase [Secundilactobacillus paracollinoides]
MDWTELSVTTTSEAVEAVSNILMTHGATGVQIDDVKDFEKLRDGHWEQEGKIIDVDEIPHQLTGAKVSAYFPETIFVPEIVPEITQQVQSLTKFGLAVAPATVETTAVDETNWATAWKKYYHPVQVTRFLTVVPSWEKYEPQSSDERLIVLDPGMAFGTGTHPTTRLSLEALEMVIRGGERLIDVGTGSGVLSIAAKQLGVGDVRAYDLDQVAVDSAQKNLDLNPVAKDVKVAANNLLTGITGQADIIVANILAEIIMPLIPQAWDLLPVHGYFVTSGIIAEKASDVIVAQEHQGFKIVQTLKMGDWFGVVAQKPGEDD